MWVTWWIAKKYFFSKKKRNFINILSYISMFGVAVGTAALVIVLSVFNGLEELTLGIYSKFYAQLQISPQIGKSFEYDSRIKNILKQTAGIQAVTEVIEDNALLKYQENQLAVHVRGVSANFNQQYDLASQLIDGDFVLMNKNTPYALIGVGIQNILSISLEDDLHQLLFWYPKKDQKVQLNPEKAFHRAALFPSGVLGVEQQFDYNHVIVPIEFAEELMHYGNKRTSLEIRLLDPKNIEQIQEELQEKLGKNFLVRTLEEQQANVLKAVKIERLFVFITFSFILAIASFNIFFSLAMMVIEKQKDVAILQSLGLQKNQIRQIFIFQGSIIAFSGAVVGLFLGFLICFLQQHYGIVGIGIENALTKSYPVKMKLADFGAISFIMLLITLLIAIVPAQNASKIVISEHI